MPTIRFSKPYDKLPILEGLDYPKKAELLQVIRVHHDDLAQPFIQYDTEVNGVRAWNLPRTHLLLLILATNTPAGMELFTTLRSWNEEKEKYYRTNVGTEFDIEVKK
jgi:hypothetical protein